jgi:P27 family predicted phage terminase small subunit
MSASTPCTVSGIDEKFGDGLMGDRGPKPLPANVLRLHGNDRLADERDQSTPKPHPVAPKPPRELSYWARRCWRLHAPELERLGLLTVLDGASFQMLCESFAMAVEALELMRPRKKDGTTDRRFRTHRLINEDANGVLRRHPAVIIYRGAAADYRAWCQRFGLTPSDRIGLRPGAPIGAEPGDDIDRDDEFFG